MLVPARFRALSACHARPAGRRSEARSFQALSWTHGQSALQTASVSSNSHARTNTSVTHPDQPVPSDVQTKIDRWSKSMLIPYARPPIILSHGKASKVWDTSGREYLDFTAGISVNALGHADDQVADVMFKQATKLTHCSNLYHNEHAGLLAESLVQLTQKLGGLGFSSSTTPNSTSKPTSGCKVFFANSGTEANEGALKFARKFGKVEDPSGSKHQLVCFTNGFHGRTFGALSVTHQPKYQLPFAPLIPGVVAGHLNDIDALESLVGPETCGVIVEPIQAEGGIMEASEDFLRALRSRCDAVGAVLIYDEIQCGLGRTGTLWAHGSLPADCHPDIVTMAKPLANGIPIGAIMMTDRVASRIQLGDHGTTFGGGPLQTSVAHHVLRRIGADEFLGNVRRTGCVLKTGLDRLLERFPSLLNGPVRGRGLILGLDVTERGELIKEVVRMCRERGVLVLSCGSNTIRFVPSLVVTEEEVGVLLKVLEQVLNELQGSL